MMRVVWVALVAVGAVSAGIQTSHAQYGGPYPPAYVPPAYTQRQVIPDLPPTVNLQPSNNGSYYAPPGTPADGCPPQYLQDGYTGYANEQDVLTGWYISGMAGALYLEDQFNEAVDSNISRQQAIAFDWNANAGMAFGYRFPTRPHDLGQLRMEVDTMFNQNNVKTLVFNGVEQDPSGEVSANSFMFNLSLDLIHWGDVITPYVGGGVGFMRVAERIRYGNATLNDEDFVFAFQGMAGISVQLWERVEWFTEWRYLGGNNPRFDRIGGPAAPNRVELRSEYNTHSIMSGLRIHLH